MLKALLEIKRYTDHVKQYPATMCGELDELRRINTMATEGIIRAINGIDSLAAAAPLAESAMQNRYLVDAFASMIRENDAQRTGLDETAIQGLPRSVAMRRRRYW